MADEEKTPDTKPESKPETKSDTKAEAKPIAKKASSKKSSSTAKVQPMPPGRNNVGNLRGIQKMPGPDIVQSAWRDEVYLSIPSLQKIRIDL